MKTCIGNQRGSVLNVALLVLVLITLIAIGLQKTTNTDIKIANNDKLYKAAFYEADAGVSVGARLLEESLACRPVMSSDPGQTYRTIGKLRIADLGLWQIERDAQGDAVKPEDDNFHVFFPYNYSSGEPHTNITVASNTNKMPGSGLRMVEGYIGPGKSAAGGGTARFFTIRAQHVGKSKSAARITTEYTHINSLELDCRYIN